MKFIFDWKFIGQSENRDWNEEKNEYTMLGTILEITYEIIKKFNIQMLQAHC